MSDDPVIRFEDVTKDYHDSTLSSVGIKQMLLRLPSYLRERRRSGTFRALEGVSFQVQRGECFGIIGPNGSGKSTTLGLIARVLRPTAGAVEAHGRVCPLLELGAGFHPELTGRENIFLNGILLGLTKAQIRSRLADIIAFSGLEEFIEHPIRTYSSGMVTRLGFSVVAHLDPEILLVDEILAVGDEAFQKKCLDRMQRFRESRTTIVFVSHDLAAIRRICDRAALLIHGRLEAIGPAAEVADEYVRRVASG